MTIGVVVVDDQALVRAGFRVLVDSEAGSVCSRGLQRVEAVALVAQTHPDVVLMDVRMPEMDGIEATRLILGPAKGRFPYLDSDYLRPRRVRLRGVKGWSKWLLVEGHPPSELLTAIRVIAGGDALLVRV